MCCPIPISNRLCPRLAVPFPRLLSSFVHTQSNPFDLDHETVRRTLFSYSNDWNRAFEFFNWVESEFRLQHSTETFNHMLNILGKFSQFNLSWDLVRRMHKTPSSPPPFSRPNHDTFRIMFRHYASAHRVDEAVDTFQRLEEFNLKDHASFCNLIEALCKFGHVGEAQDLIFGKNEKINADRSTKVCNLVLRGWVGLRCWSKCLEFWEEMGRKGVHKDLHSYTIYVDMLYKSGEHLKAVEIFEELKSKGVKLDVVISNIVIRAIGSSKGVDFSIRMLGEMKECGIVPTVVTYNSVIKLLCENDRFKEAIALLNMMRRKECQPNSFSYHFFFDCLEEPKVILMLFDRMIDSGVRPSIETYVMLMRKFGRWGFLRPVMLVWKRMEDLGCSPDAAAYDALIDALVEKGLIDLARKYKEEMLARGFSPQQKKELGTKLVIRESEGE